MHRTEQEREEYRNSVTWQKTSQNGEKPGKNTKFNEIQVGKKQTQIITKLKTMKDFESSKINGLTHNKNPQ